MNSKGVVVVGSSKVLIFRYFSKQDHNDEMVETFCQDKMWNQCILFWKQLISEVLHQKVPVNIVGGIWSIVCDQQTYIPIYNISCQTS